MKVQQLVVEEGNTACLVPEESINLAAVPIVLAEQILSAGSVASTASPESFGASSGASALPKVCYESGSNRINNGQ